VSGNTANATSAAGTRTGEINMGIIGFRAPECPAICIIIKKGEVQIAMENISSR